MWVDSYVMVPRFSSTALSRYQIPACHIGCDVDIISLVLFRKPLYDCALQIGSDTLCKLFVTTIETHISRYKNERKK